MNLIFLAQLARAATLTVDPAGGGDFAAINDAIAAASDGDTVLVLPGTYSENLSFLGKSIVVRADAGPQYTALDGGDIWDESTVSFVMGEPEEATLQGFTVTNGHGQPAVWNLGRSWTGAGVLIHESAGTIADCVIADNAARHSGQSVGGGVGVIRGYAEIRGNEFRDNLGYYAGGGVALLGGFALVEDNTFTGNRSGRGAALAALDGATATLTGNLYQGNAALYGGALYAHESTINAVGEQFLDNEAGFDGGTLFAVDSQVSLGRCTLDGGVAARDGGHLYVAPGSSLIVGSSALLRGAALAGGAVFARGEGASVSLDGVLMAQSFAAETGAELWSADAAVLLDQLTSLDAETPGALIWLHGGEATLLDALFSGGTAASTCYAEDLTASLDWSLIYDFSGDEAAGTCAIGDGIVREDPALADLSAWPPDVRLSAGSPAIDAGDPGRTDADGSRADIGATGGLSPWEP